MNWYLAKIVFQIISGKGNHTAQFDEQLRLISSCSKADAFYKAQQLGLREEESFFNKNRELVKWKFINVSDIYKLGEMIDGAELYSRIDEKFDGEEYIKTVNNKASGILHSGSHELLQLV